MLAAIFYEPIVHIEVGPLSLSPHGIGIAVNGGNNRIANQGNLIISVEGRAAASEEKAGEESARALSSHSRPSRTWPRTSQYSHSAPARRR